MQMTKTAAVATDLLVGIGAGLVAGWAMNLFQSAWITISEEPEPEETAASKSQRAWNDVAVLSKQGQREALHRMRTIQPMPVCA